MKVTYNGLPNCAINSTVLMSLSLRVEGFMDKLGAQSNGVSVIGACTESTLRARLDFAYGCAGNKVSRWEFVERYITNSGCATK